MHMCGFLLLLVSVLTQTNCQCSEDETQSAELSHPCNQVYAALESALVNTDNLYVLRNTLYPSSRFAPALLKVNYNIRLSNNRTFTTTLGWTDSGVFAAINPRTLFDLQLRILYWPLRNKLLEPGTIELKLHARSNEVLDLSQTSTNDVTEVLKILNARLLVYATMQDVLTDWDGTDLGYTWDVQGGNDALLSFIVIVTTPIAVILFLALFATLRTVLDDNNSSSLFHFLYGLEVPALVLIVFEFLSSFFLLAECQNFSCIIKFCSTIAVFICGYFFTLYAIYKTNRNQHGICIKFFKFLHQIFLNFVFLKALVAVTSISFIPLILLVIVYPAEILCTLIIYLSIITMSAVMLSPLTIASVEITKQDWRHGGAAVCGSLQDVQTLCNKTWKTVVNMKHLLLVLAVFFNVSLAAMLLCLLYMQALLAGATSNVAVNFVLFIITALIPGGLVYGTGKAVQKRFFTGEMVYVITDEQLGEFVGPYTVKHEVDPERCIIEDEDKKNRVVKLSSLMKQKEHEKLTSTLSSSVSTSESPAARDGSLQEHTSPPEPSTPSQHSSRPSSQAEVAVILEDRPSNEGMTDIHSPQQQQEDTPSTGPSTPSSPPTEPHSLP